MSCLKILLLHDNPIGKLENLHHLSACECLTVLTLYDTPLSLKRNYRHHVVNSIWTLQALDSMVISDEEIIEDAVFGGEFSAMHPAFHINLCPMLSEVIMNLNGLLLFYIHLKFKIVGRLGRSGETNFEPCIYIHDTCKFIYLFIHSYLYIKNYLLYSFIYRPTHFCYFSLK